MGGFRFVVSAAVTGFLLAVDYGTSNTVAVLRDPDGRTGVLAFDGAPLLPSAIYADPDGRIITGRDAQRSARLDPTRYEPHPKRHIDDGEILLGDRGVPVVELAATTLRRVAAEAARMAGGPIGELVMTYPVEWGPRRRGMLPEAAQRAGLPRPTLVPEPVAAATYFVTALGHQVPPGRSVVVYDLGGGTFDACVVRRTPAGFEPLAYRGLDDVGGVDLDDLVVAQVGHRAGRIAPELWSRITRPTEHADRRHFRALWDDARAAKETLSRQPDVTLFVPLVDRDVRVTREEFEQSARPALGRTVDVTMDTIRQARVQPTDVVGVFLVGGATRVPMIATLLHHATGRPPVVLEQPELVVAEGALRAVDAQSPAGAPTAPVPMSHRSGPSGPPAPMSAPPGQIAPMSGPSMSTSLDGWSARPAPSPVMLKKQRQIRNILIGGLVGVLLIIGGTVGAVTFHHYGQSKDTRALYEKVGLPDGFAETAEPQMKSNTWLTVRASSTDQNAASATHDWLASMMDNPPDINTLTSRYYKGSGTPQFIAADKFEPHSVSFHLSRSGNTYRIATEIIY